MPSILGVGQSGLAAAQVGITTTGHNITNASTPGYSRQLVIQASKGGQQIGAAFQGQGTDVVAVQRVFDNFTASRVNASQTSKSSLDAYNAQITQIDNLFADPTTGLSPTLQDFFGNIQGLAADPGSAAQRQTLLSSSQSLVSRFRSLDDQLSQIGDGVNKQITGSVTNINSYTQQIAKLNDAIAKVAASADGALPNDLLDQRDLLINQLSKEVKVTVSDQPGTGYNVSIGNGQPLVIGNATFTLQITNSPTDQNRLEVGYVTATGLTRLPESSFTGGTLGGLFDFRSITLDPARNELGRVALGLASQINDQSRLGIDLNGKPGKNFFTIPGPQTTPSSLNTGNTLIDATVVDVTALTASDYRVAFDGTNYNVTRLKDNVLLSTGALPVTLDGINFTKKSGTTVNAGDNYLVRPTVASASGIAVALTDKTEIAAAAPIVTAAGVTVPATGPSTNGGNGKISAGSVDATYLAAPLTTPVKLSFNGGSISSSPAVVGFPQPYVSGQNISFGGITFNITGAPINGDTFTIAPNTTGSGDGRNAVALGALQTKQVFDNNSNTFGSAYGLFVSNVGNKAREVSVNAAAEGKLLANAVAVQQSQSGVNLDEEASNLLRYQQAYQAAGKLMQTASTLFDVLLGLGK